MKKKQLRESQLLDALGKKGHLNINEIIQMLDVSESTARRIIVELEERGLAIRKFGGIQVLPPTQPTYSYTELEQEMIDEKIRIGQFACSLVSDNDVIYLFGGTTTYQMARSLEQKLLKNELRNITVLTTSLANVEVLGNCCKVILIGGEYRPQRRDFAGFIAEKLVKTISISHCFMGVDGINLEDGLMSYDVETARIDELIISRSALTTVLCDSSKFTKMSFISLSPIEKVKNIITDTGISPITKAEFDAKGITLYCV